MVVSACKVSKAHSPDKHSVLNILVLSKMVVLVHSVCALDDGILVCAPDDGILVCAPDDGILVCAPDDGILVCALVAM